MIAARGLRITALDFEGTGPVSGWPDEPWQIGLVDLQDGQIVARSAYESLLKVGDRPFNPHAPGRHSQIRDALRQAPALNSLWPVLAPRLEGVVLAAHNAATETRYLSCAFPLHPPVIALDTLKLARVLYPTLGSYKLDDILDRLQLNARVQSLAPGRSPHDALYDAIGCAALLEHLFTLPGWGTAPLDTLIQAQSRRRKRKDNVTTQVAARIGTAT